MKRTITIFILLISIVSFAQDFQGKATYKTHQKIDIKISDGKGAPSEETQKKFAAQLKKQFQKTYTLNFTKSESNYTQNEELSAPQPQASGVQIQIIGSGGGTDVLYKNVTDKTYKNKTEISGKRFLIDDKLEDYGWQMTSETKNIGKYTCYKAIRTKEIEYTTFNVDNGKEKEEKKTKTVETVAWYTPQIPVSNGPEKYWGLPGLILEIQEGKKTIVCSEIVLNPKEKITIEVPKKGKKVTQKEYETIMDKHTKEMMERFKNRRKSKDGNSMHIEIKG